MPWNSSMPPMRAQAFAPAARELQDKALLSKVWEDIPKTTL